MVRWRSGQGAGLAISKSLATLDSDPGEVVHVHVLLLPSSIIWYLPKGGDALRPGR